MIYYIEDDENIRQLVVYTLNQTGLTAMGCEDSTQFYKENACQKAELVLLDIMLPREDGIAVLGKLKENSATADLPVIMVSAKSTEFDKVHALELGADDYITKPFGMMELVARVKALLRRSTHRREDLLRAGDLLVNVDARKVMVQGREVTLTYREFELLIYLMRQRGKAFNRDQLLDALWGYDYDGGTRTVDVHIQTLRQKLGSCGKMIETVRSVGYRFHEDSGDAGEQNP